MPKKLPWYEKDGFLTWYDQCKCKDFLNDTDKHFGETKIGNFDIIHKQCSGEKMPESVLKNYQTLDHDRIEKFLANCEEKVLSRAFRTNQKDISFEKRTTAKKF